MRQPQVTGRIRARHLVAMSPALEAMAAEGGLGSTTLSPKNVLIVSVEIKVQVLGGTMPATLRGSSVVTPTRPVKAPILSNTAPPFAFGCRGATSLVPEAWAGVTISSSGRSDAT